MHQQHSSEGILRLQAEEDVKKRENDKLKEQLIELRRVIAEQLGTRSLENPVDEWFPPSKGVKE